MLVIFNGGAKDTPIHLDLPQDEAEEVVVLSRLQHRPSTGSVVEAWRRWVAAAADEASRERRVQVGEAMRLQGQSLGAANA